MQELELISLWKDLDHKHQQQQTELNELKIKLSAMDVKSNLASMKPIKLFTLFIGILWVGFGAYILAYLFIHAYKITSSFFLYSAAAQILLTAIAIWVYIYQLALIWNVDYAAPIIKTQETLHKLKSSTLWVTRVLILQFPLWTTFYLSEKMLVESGTIFIIIQSILTLSFSVLAIWLFKNIHIKNSQKKWFRLFIRGIEWEPIIRSAAILEQVKEYKTIG